MDIIIMITDKHKTFIHKKRMYEMSFKMLNALVSKVRCVRCGESNWHPDQKNGRSFHPVGSLTTSSAARFKENATGWLRQEVHPVCIKSFCLTNAAKAQMSDSHDVDTSLPLISASFCLIKKSVLNIPPAAVSSPDSPLEIYFEKHERVVIDLHEMSSLPFYLERINCTTSTHIFRNGLVNCSIENRFFFFFRHLTFLPKGMHTHTHTH